MYVGAISLRRTLLFGESFRLIYEAKRAARAACVGRLACASGSRFIIEAFPQSSKKLKKEGKK